MSSASGNGLDTQIDEHVGMFAAVLPDAELLPSYLTAYLSETIGPDNVDRLEHHVYNGFTTYMEDAETAELAGVYSDMVLEDMEQAVSDHGIHPTYMETILESAVPVAADILEKNGYSVDADDVNVTYLPENLTGSKYHRPSNTIRIGRTPEQLSFSPSVLGLQVHELYHVYQHQEKQREGVEDHGFSWEDEVIPHALYIEVDGLLDDPERYDDYMDTVVKQYDRGEQLAERIEQQLPETV